MDSTPFFPLIALPFLGEYLEIQKLFRASRPVTTSRPSVTIGKRQMSQKSRANRRKARRRS